MRSLQPIHRKHQQSLRRRGRRSIRIHQAGAWGCLVITSAIALTGYWLKPRLLHFWSSLQSGATEQGIQVPVIAYSPPINPMQRAQESAMSAAHLNQSAHSLNDWHLVMQQWQQAIAQLQTIPQTSSDYPQAQQKIKEYQENLTYAQQQMAQRLGENSGTPFPLPATKAARLPQTLLTCTTAAQTDQAPLAITQLKEYPIADRIALIGCITNYSHQRLTHVAVTYQAKSAQDAQFFQGGFGYLQMPALQPGETAIFRSEFEVPSHVTEVKLSGIYWKLDQKQDMQGASVSEVLAF